MGTLQLSVKHEDPSYEQFSEVVFSVLLPPVQISRRRIVKETTATMSHVWLSALFAVVLGAMPSQGQVDVATWHNDNGRTGQNTHETVLTRTLVSNRNPLADSAPQYSMEQFARSLW